jgi:hypothetical protein
MKNNPTKKPLLSRGNRWRESFLRKEADLWMIQQMEQYHKKTASEKDALWWHFRHQWEKHRDQLIHQLIEGTYQVEPMRRLHFKPSPGEPETIHHHPCIWSYQDKLATRLIQRVIKPTFEHIISERCLHLSGPGKMKSLNHDLKAGLESGQYHYFIRTDIKSAYHSINRDKLWDIVQAHFDDPILLNYLNQIIYHCIDDGGKIILDPPGIPWRSALSGFFSALYMKALDVAFENIPNCFYVRFNDDILILLNSKGQYRRGKKRLTKILASLDMPLSPTKTTMGRLSKKSFHFLGAEFSVQQSLRIQSQPIKAVVSLHPRSARRAKDKAEALISSGVNPYNVQSYLIRWSAWWSKTIPQAMREELLSQWLSLARDEKASGLLIQAGQGAWLRTQPGQ